MCLHSGEFYHYEIEHHLSLIHHLVFMIESELNRPDQSRNTFCIKQVKHICASHHLLNSDDLVILESENQEQILTCLQKINDEPIVNSALGAISTLNNLKSYLIELRNELEPDYFKNIVLSLAKKIVCQHSLKHHKKHLEYLAKLTFAYYYLSGYSRKVIDKITDRIFANEVTQDGQRIYTDAYLPKELYQRQINHNRSNASFDKRLFNDIKRYLKRRNQVQQIEQLFDVLHYEGYEYNLLFRLEGLILFPDRETSEIDVLGVKIMSTREFKKKYNQFNYDDTGGFFQEGQSAIAKISSRVHNQEDAVFDAIENLRDKLGRIMRHTKSRFSLSYTGYTSFPDDETGYWINTMPEVAKIGQYDVQDLNYIEDKLGGSPHKEFYLELDQMLQEAFLEDNVATSIHFLRKFIDMLGMKAKTSEVSGMNGFPADIRTVAYLMTYFEKRKFRAQTINWVHNKMINAEVPSAEGELLSRKYSREVLANNRKISYPFIANYIDERFQHERYEFNRARYYSKHVDEKQAFEYYCRQLLYIKQYRDKHEHANITDDVIARKLGVYSYRLLSRLLQDLFHEIFKDENNERALDEILRDMAIEAKNRL